MTVVFYDCDESVMPIEVPVLDVCSHDGYSKWPSWEQLKKIHVNNLKVTRGYRWFLSSDLSRPLLRARHRNWQKRQPDPQSRLRELRQRARSACFVPVRRKMQNNRDFTLSPLFWSGQATDLRTFYEDYLKCIEFCEWLKEKAERQ